MVRDPFLKTKKRTDPVVKSTPVEPVEKVGWTDAAREAAALARKHGYQRDKGLENERHMTDEHERLVASHGGEFLNHGAATTPTSIYSKTTIGRVESTVKPSGKVSHEWDSSGGHETPNGKDGPATWGKGQAPNPKPESQIHVHQEDGHVLTIHPSGKWHHENGGTGDETRSGKNSLLGLGRHLAAIDAANVTAETGTSQLRPTRPLSPRDQRDADRTTKSETFSPVEKAWSEAAREAAALARQHGYGKGKTTGSYSHPSGHQLIIDPDGAWTHAHAGNLPTAQGSDQYQLRDRLEHSALEDKYPTTPAKPTASNPGIDATPNRGGKVSKLYSPAVKQAPPGPKVVESDIDCIEPSGPKVV